MQPRESVARGEAVVQVFAEQDATLFVRGEPSRLRFVRVRMGWW